MAFFYYSTKTKKHIFFSFRFRLTEINCCWNRLYSVLVLADFIVSLFVAYTNIYICVLFSVARSLRISFFVFFAFFRLFCLFYSVDIIFYSFFLCYCCWICTLTHWNRIDSVAVNTFFARCRHRYTTIIHCVCVIFFRSSFLLLFFYFWQARTFLNDQCLSLHTFVANK